MEFIVPKTIRFEVFLAERSPSVDLAKEFLAQFADRKPRTLYRYAQMVKSFMKWYGQPMDEFKVKIPRTLPHYIEDDQIEKLLKAIDSKRTHKGSIVRDQLLVQLDVKTGLRRAEMANLRLTDLDLDKGVVRVIVKVIRKESLHSLQKLQRYYGHGS